MSWRVVFFIALIGSLYACVRMGQGVAIDASQHQPKPNYRQKIRDMIHASEWCRFYYRGNLFLVKTEKLHTPLKMLVGEGPEDLRRLDENVKFTPDEDITFFNKEGKEIGSIGMWTSGAYILPVIRFTKRDVSLELNEDTIATFLKESKPVLFRFENNIEALSSKKSNLIQYSLRAIVQRPFKDQSKKAIQIVEPYLMNSDNAIKYTAAEALLNLVPMHKEAKRLYWEERHKRLGDQ